MAATVALVAVVGVGLGAVWVLGGGSGASAADAARALAGALERGRLQHVSFANSSGAPAACAWDAIRAAMTPATPEVSVGRSETRGASASVSLHWLWRLPFGRSWSYEARLSLRSIGGAWKPVWSASVVNPNLGRDDTMQLSEVPASRAPILDGAGRPILERRPVVNVGVEPKRVRDLAMLVARLHAILGVDAQELATRVRAASPSAFVPVITLRRSAYERVRSRIHPLPGTVFTTGTLLLAPTSTFARSLLGTVGPATAQIVKESRGRVAPNELVGLSGLEAALDPRLRGEPGFVVRAMSPRGVPGRTLFSSPARPGKPVRISLEIPAQEAADTALVGVKQPAALVAIRISTGNVIASAVAPDPAGYDIALQGRYPPGSTFKVVTALALLERGERPSDTVDCPAQIVVDGKAFHNAEREVLGPTTFAQDFVHSCDTAFASLGPRVAGDILPATARELGIGRALDLGLPTFAGAVPRPAGPVELAADTFGQGRILVSPLAMAGVAAAVARGRWQAPHLVLDPAPSPEPTTAPLPAAALGELRTLMREVVTSGTGTVLASQPGPPVYGKTGTAETGTGNPPRTDAWFIGYQGDVAFAAVVADTNNGFGGTVAAPIISRFLRALS